MLLFTKAHERAAAPVLLVIGVHREELAFGEAVAERLDPRHIAVLRIPKGLTGDRPGPDRIQRYRQHHRDLYGQILDHVRPAHRLLIDLHTGLDEGRCWADVLCADTGLLRCIDARTASTDSCPAGSLCTVQLIGDRPPAPDAAAGEQASRTGLALPADRPAMRPEIPEAVWRSTDPLYVGLEVYLPTTDQPQPPHVDFAAAVIRLLDACALDRLDAAVRG